MANWANVVYCVEGKGTRKLHDDIVNVMKRPDEQNPKWIGGIYELNGIDTHGCDIRGFFNDVSLRTDSILEDILEGGCYLRIDMECAWCEKLEWRHKIESLYDVKIYYIEEEEGNGVFKTNDRYGIYFTTRYFLELSGHTEYYDTPEEVIDAINSMYPLAKIEDIDGAHRFIDRMDNDDPDDYFVLCEYSVADD